MHCTGCPSRWVEHDSVFYKFVSEEKKWGEAKVNFNILYRTGEAVDLTLTEHSLFRAQEPKAPVTYCDHALSGVRRPSVVRRPLDYLHFRLLLQNRLIDFDETWYG